MKTIAAAFGLVLCAPIVSAFPRAMYEAVQNLPREVLEEGAAKRDAILGERAAAAPQGVGYLPLTPPPFDPKTQYVSNKGQHKFVPPGPGDDRGECPGLNALANHGYLPHNGRATIQEFITGTWQGFGMAPDLGGFLAVYGAVVDGDLTSWSIAGGPHVGIGGSHGDYESDSSPCRGDLHQYGSNTDVVMSQFNYLYNMQPDAATANYNLDVLQKFRSHRFTESVNKNPWFAYEPFTGIAVSQAAFTFIYRFMANKSAEYPEGRLDKHTLKSFYSIYGEEDNLYWVPGHERFPDNFYKRHYTDDYSIPYFITDVVAFGERDPNVINIGCNQGKVNTYNSINPAILTDGAYTLQQAAQSPFCFAAEFAAVELPVITGLSDSDLAPLLQLLKAGTAGMNCAAIGSVNQTVLSACPGFSLYGGPNGVVAPGAIQS